MDEDLGGGQSASTASCGARREGGSRPGPCSVWPWGDVRSVGALAERLVLTMVRRDMGLKHLEVLPLGVAVLLQLGLECFSPVMVVIGIFGGKDKQKR